MTEAEWQACTDPTPMLEFLRGKASDRKLRLFSCACCRRALHLIHHESAEAAEVAEDFADGRVTQEELDRALLAIFGAAPHAHTVVWSVIARNAWDAAISTAREVVGLLREGEVFDPSMAPTKESLTSETKPVLNRNRLQPFWMALSEAKAQQHLLLDIFGNPFRPLTAAPSWLTSTDVSLAQAIYDDRAFDRLPILADALEDAGCTNVEILNHCRQPGEHVRGC